MNVLLLSDFSKVAINATHFAMDLLKDQQVNFFLLNIYDPDSAKQSPEEKRNATLAVLEERVQKLQERSKNRPHKVTGHYSEDTLVKAARDFVAEHRIHLIAMGSVGEEQRSSTILGKHTFEIMCKIKCNILAVPEDVTFQKKEKLLMPMDYSVSFGSRNIQFLDNPELFSSLELHVWEIKTRGTIEDENLPEKKEIFSSLENVATRFDSIDAEAIQNPRVWSGVQNNFDLIVLLGKNIKICDDLLHDKNALYRNLPNRLPILLLHD